MKRILVRAKHFSVNTKLLGSRFDEWAMNNNKQLINNKNPLHHFEERFLCVFVCFEVFRSQVDVETSFKLK